MGNHLTPSYVAFTDHAILVGELAKQQQSTNPMNTFVEFKRVLGRTFEQKGLWRDANHWVFKLVRPTENGDGADAKPMYSAMVHGELTLFTAVELTTLLIKHMAETIRDFVNVPILGLVATIPAHFDHNQRKETLQAVRDAGLTSNVRICNEPTAAAVAYAEKNPVVQTPGQIMLVFDLGAGTLDVTCLESVRVHEYTILGSKGLGDLGGADFDKCLQSLVLKRYRQETKKDLRTNSSQMVLMRDACENAKKVLSIATETTLVIEGMSPWTIKRADFEAAIADHVQRCADLMWALLHDIKKTPSDVHHLILVGGSSRVPAVQAVVKSMFPNTHVHSNINVDECVALGASYLAHALGKSVSEEAPKSATTAIAVRDVMPCSLGIKTGENIMLVLIEQNAPLPAKAQVELFPQHRKQKHVDVEVYQGTHSCTTYNSLLGKVRLDGLRMGQPPLTLQVDVNADGMVSIQITDDEGHAVSSSINL
jgi:molecular chaperone DnaK (HSP70)